MEVSPSGSVGEFCTRSDSDVSVEPTAVAQHPNVSGIDHFQYVRRGAIFDQTDEVFE